MTISGLNRTSFDINFGRECLVNRTLVRDLHQFRALFVGQRPGQTNVAPYAIYFSFLRFAIVAISSVNL